MALSDNLDLFIHAPRPRAPYGHSINKDPIIPDAVWFIVDATKLFDVQVYSCRSASPEGIVAMQEWLPERMEEEAAEQGVDAFDRIGWPTTKPAALVSIDDRGLTFAGGFPDPASLLAFRPWNRPQPAPAPRIHWSR